MDPEQISRLREEQLKAIEQTNSRISQLETFKEDYVALRDKLKTLPNKMQHDVMVPFGDLAFMPGQLIHTNEILVLLGDNWFADRSASQAAAIVNRRIKAVDDQVKELEEQKGLLKPRLEFTSEFTDIAEGRNDVKDIREEYNEKKEIIWREKHRKSVHRYRQELRQENKAKQSLKEEHKKPMTDEELWARLDELEVKEGLENEMDRLTDGERSSETETDESSEDEEDEASRKKVRWKDSSADITLKRNVITFTHSRADSPSDKKSTDEIQSPGDIYRHFVQETRPTSILKSPSGDFTEPVTEKQPHRVVPSTSDAFTGSIVERQDAEQSSSPITGPVETETRGAQKVSLFKSRQRDDHNSGDKRIEQEQLPVLEEPPKRVSKFKAQRQQMQR